MEATYIDHMGDDLRVANAARVSFAKHHDTFTTRAEAPVGSDEGIIHYLATHDHWTPFSHAMVTMRERVPIFVARQRFKHMVGFTYNEESRRYVDDDPEFFTPDTWRKRAENKKQGSSDEVLEGVGHDTVHDEYRGFLYQAYTLYEMMLKEGVAPEQARMVLPQSMYTTYYCTGSLAAWARAYKLRTDPHAQKEIQDLAHMWDGIIRPLFPVSWPALTEN